MFILSYIFDSKSKHAYFIIYSNANELKELRINKLRSVMNLSYTPSNMCYLIFKYIAVYYHSNNTPSEVTTETIQNGKLEQCHNE